MAERSVYLDYNATTPLHPKVRRLIIEELELFGNASSLHTAGRLAAERVEQARLSVGALIGAAANELVFTSGGSESNNSVFQSIGLNSANPTRNEVIITAIEHPCVQRSAEFLVARGFKLHVLPVDRTGLVCLDVYESLISERTSLVSIMLANNEIGTIQDLAPLVKAAKAVGAWFHTDAVQAVGKIPVNLANLGVDYLSLSAHKIYGPKAVGALYVRKTAPFEPLIRGGHQEQGRRAGTYNVGGISAFGLAAELARLELTDYGQRSAALRNRLRDGLLEKIPSAQLNGHPQRVLPNTVNLSFPGAEGEAILLSLDLAGIQVSTGSACASGSLEPSPVLMATGVGPELAHGSIRFSLGRDTTEADIDYVITILPPIIERLRAMSTVR